MRQPNPPKLHAASYYNCVRLPNMNESPSIVSFSLSLSKQLTMAVSFSLSLSKQLTMAETKSSQTPKPMLPWKTRISVSFLSALTDAARLPDGTINRRLMKFFDRKTQPKPSPFKGVSTSDVTVDPTRNLWFRIFAPTATASTSLPVVIFFHGGCFAFLSPASFVYDAICRRFAFKIPAVVVSVNYRLCPEHRYPSQYDDGLDVIKFLDENRGVLPDIADVSKCFLVGDSSGANIAHHVSVRIFRSVLREVKVIGLISIQPFFGGEERTESEILLEGAPLISVERTDRHWNMFLPDGSDRDHEAVNVSGPNAVDISGMDYPDTLVFVGGFDPLQDWQRRYHEWLRKSGKEAQLIEYPSMIHAFYLFPDVPESSQLISDVKDFINKTVADIK